MEEVGLDRSPGSGALWLDLSIFPPCSHTSWERSPRSSTLCMNWERRQLPFNSASGLRPFDFDAKMWQPKLTWQTLVSPFQNRRGNGKLFLQWNNKTVGSITVMTAFTAVTSFKKTKRCWDFAVILVFFSFRQCHYKQLEIAQHSLYDGLLEGWGAQHQTVPLSSAADGVHCNVYVGIYRY